MCSSDLYKNVIKKNKLFKEKPEHFVDENKNFNMNFLTNFIIEFCMDMSKGLRHSFKLHDYNQEAYKKYIYGLLWCFESYKANKCIDFSYYYEFDCNPHPIGLLFWLQTNKEVINIKFDLLNKIPDEVYSVLILPRAAKCYIAKKYHNLIDKKLDYLYGEEECNICCKYHKELSGLRKSVAFMRETEQDIENISVKLLTGMKELRIHKKIHKEIDYADILKTIKLCTSLK